jgi:hypothetical protein
MWFPKAKFIPHWLRYGYDYGHDISYFVDTLHTIMAVIKFGGCKARKFHMIEH